MGNDAAFNRASLRLARSEGITLVVETWKRHNGQFKLTARRLIDELDAKGRAQGAVGPSQQLLVPRTRLSGRL